MLNQVTVSQPSFSSPEQEREHRKERLAAALRIFAYLGYEEGVTGHITARDPELTDHFWINPLGMAFSHIRVSDLVLVSDSGKVVEGRFGTHQAPFSIHSAIYRARPDVQAAAHSHSMYGKTLAAMGGPLEPLTQDSCAFFGDQGYFDEYTGIVLDDTEGKRLGAALGQHKALILRSHGLLTVGGSVDSAAWWFIAMERSCQAQLMARAAGKATPIPDDEAARTHEEIGSDFNGWLNFQPMHQHIVRLQPDLLE